MELSTQITMLLLLGITIWAAMSATIIMFGQPAPIGKTNDWAVPAAYAFAAAAFGIMVALTTPLPEII